MAKKFTKFLAFTAVIGAAAAGAYYYMHRKDKEIFDDFDDFDDEEEDQDKVVDFFPKKEESAEDRNYVPLDFGTKTEGAASQAENADKDEKPADGGEPEASAANNLDVEEEEFKFD